MLNVKRPEEVLELIHREFDKTAETEMVSLGQARGRVLAEDILAEEYVPDFNRSTVDGYAVHARDTFGCSDSIPAILPLQGEVLMGQPADFVLQPENCAQVPTGGAIPEGADSVVMLEYTEDYGDGSIGIEKPAAPGMNMIFRGDDVFPGKVVLKAGRVLTAQDIGALAAIGKTQIPVERKLLVGVISTGDELVPPEVTPGPGQIRDVNSPMLEAVLQAAGYEVKNYGIVIDDEQLLGDKVKLAVEECDAVLLSGGSSVGVKDAACKIIESLGTLFFHGIAMKPGKPTILGKSGNVPVAGLPGHPVAAYFITRLFILPLLAQMSGKKMVQLPVTAKITENIGANHGRAEAVGCRLFYKDGVLMAEPIRGKSGLITSLAGTDGYFMIDRDCEGLPQGAEVKVMIHAEGIY